MSSGDIHMEFGSEIFSYLFFASLVPIVIVFIIFAIFRVVYLRRQELAQQTIVAEYEAPDGLTPAEIGYLYDYKIGEPELQATVLQLRQRGLSLGSPDLLPHETSALNVKDDRFVRLTPVAENTYQADFPLFEFQHAVKESLIRRGYLYRSRVKGWLKRIALVFLLMSPLPILSFSSFVVFQMLQAAPATDSATLLFFAGASGLFAIIIAIFMLPLYVFTAIIVVYLYTRVVGQRWIGTPLLQSRWGQLEGFRQFIRQTEMARISSDDRDGIDSNPLLPYAIALNLSHPRE